MYVGLPAGLLVLVVALPYFLALWVRAKVRKWRAHSAVRGGENGNPQRAHWAVGAI
jgi:hypothetical protein